MQKIHPRLLPQLFALICVSALTSCASVSYKAVSFDVLRPATYTLPSWADTVFIADGSLYPTVIDSTVPPDDQASVINGRAELLSQQSCQAMMNSFNKSKFLKARLWLPQKDKRGLTESDISNILDGTSHTIILSLAELRSVATIHSYVGQDDEGGAMLCGMIVSATSSRIQLITSPSDVYPLDERNDTIIFSACDYTPQAVAEQLPSISRRYLTQGNTIGEKNADAFIPVWQTVYRSLYVTTDPDILAAYSWVNKDNWDEAINLWNRAASSARHTADKVRAMLNIALAYERADDPTLAAIWCSRALDSIEALDAKKAKKLEDEKNRASSMFAYLMERQKQKEQLDAQMQ